MNSLEKQMQLKCHRCGHEWLRRSIVALPKQCPHCHTSIWAEPLLDSKDKKKIIAQVQKRNEEMGERFSDERVSDAYDEVLAKGKEFRHLVAMHQRAARKKGTAK
jgi:hypothetical protein